jgi:hypothetical protein
LCAFVFEGADSTNPTSLFIFSDFDYWQAQKDPVALIERILVKITNQSCHVLGIFFPLKSSYLDNEF